MSVISFSVSWSYIVFFFFSSRRRHTRLQGDWSSDVCSSDLSIRWSMRMGIPWRVRWVSGGGRRVADDGVDQAAQAFDLGDDLVAHAGVGHAVGRADRKSTRLNSSHLVISYAVFCLKKKESVRYEHYDDLRRKAAYLCKDDAYRTCLNERVFTHCRLNLPARTYSPPPSLPV